MHLSVGERRKEGNDFLPPLFLFVLNCEEEEEEEENANEQKRKKEEREELSISLYFLGPSSFLAQAGKGKYGLIFPVS